MRPLIRSTLCLVIASASAGGAEDPKASIISGYYNNGAFESTDFVNSIVGWNTFFNAGFRGGSTVIGSIEAGHVWSGHEVFVRAPEAVNGVSNFNSTAPGLTNELDFHATMVGHVLAGSGYIPLNSGSYTYAGLGMATEAALVSGAIVTDHFKMHHL